MMKKTYNELIKIQSYSDRLAYLKLEDKLFHKKDELRRLKQLFYKSQRWKDVRRQVLVRDNGYDLGIKGINIKSKVIIHHINPITSEDILSDNYCLYDLNNLISVSLNTHNLIHYTFEDTTFVERTINDTIPWR